MTAPAWFTQRLARGTELREVGPETYSVLAPEDARAHFDSRAAVYDSMIGMKLYNRVLWGNTPDDYARFIADAVASRQDGALLDVAAGTCLASAATYASTSRPTVVLDRSLGMLTRGRKRLQACARGSTDRVVFVHADGLALPFVDAAFTTVLSHGALQTFEDPVACGREWRRVLTPDGTLRVSSLARGGRFGNAWLALLQRTGDSAAPREAPAIAAALAEGTGRTARLTHRGNYAFVVLD